MRTHDQVVAKLMRRPGVRKEVERIEHEEGARVDLLLKARHAGLPLAHQSSQSMPVPESGKSLSIPIEGTRSGLRPPRSPQVRR